MNSIAGQIPHTRRELRFVHKALTYATWIGAGYLFYVVGGATQGQSDPEACISLIGGGQSLATFLVAVLLVVVTSGAATVLVGRYLNDAGVFAAAVGLVTLSVRGGTVEYLLLRGADAGPQGSGSLAWMFAGEVIAWAVLIAIAAVVSGVVARILGFSAPPHSPGSATGTSRDAVHAAPLTALTDVPALAARFGHPGSSAPTPAVQGVRYLALSSVIMLAFITLFSLDLNQRPVTHGQVCFIIAAAAYLATYFAAKQQPVRTALWPMLTPVVVAVLGYAWAGIFRSPTDWPPAIPYSTFLRPLPIQAIAAGVGGVLPAFWLVFDPNAVAVAPPRSKSTPAKREGRKRR